MIIKPRQVCLITGLIMFLLSFLWYAWGPIPLYQTLLGGGFLIAVISLLFILFKKDIWKKKLLWIIVFIAGFLINIYTRPVFIDLSFKSYLQYHSRDLELLNKRLFEMEGRVSVFRNSIRTENPLSSEEKAEIEALRKRIGVNIVGKKSDHVYYELWGMLDNRVGVCYYPDDSKVKAKKFKRIKKHWYVIH